LKAQPDDLRVAVEGDKVKPLFPRIG